jgi:hypothetical protein
LQKKIWAEQKVKRKKIYMYACSKRYERKIERKKKERRDKPVS